MDDLVNRSPTTWAQSRWPLPRPSVIRKNADFKDQKKRSYMKVGPNDAKELRLRKAHKWWWCALPATSVTSGMLQIAPNNKDRIHGPIRVYTVVAIGRMVDARRGLGVVALK